MAKIWSEIYDGKTPKSGSLERRPANLMPRIGQTLPFHIPAEVWFVKVCGFTFVFNNIQQLDACLRYYSSKTHPSSIIKKEDLTADLGENWRELRGWDIERWFERLPMFLLESAKREKVIKALQQAQQQWRQKYSVSTAE